jgi:hypothetical protein
MYERGHASQCRFTPKGSLSQSTVTKLVKTLTGGEIKRLAGIDDAKVLKGRYNFDRMRDLTKSIVDDIEERNQMLKEIDKIKVFYQTNFSDHLQRQSNQRCNCLSCGFSNEEEILCSNHNSHNKACTECTAGFALINQLEVLLNQKKEDQKGQQAMPCALQLQQLDEHSYDIDQARINLTEYRSHLA